MHQFFLHLFKAPVSEGPVLHNVYRVPAHPEACPEAQSPGKRVEQFDGDPYQGLAGDHPVQHVGEGVEGGHSDVLAIIGVGARSDPVVKVAGVILVAGAQSMPGHTSWLSHQGTEQDHLLGFLHRIQKTVLLFVEKDALFFSHFVRRCPDQGMVCGPQYFIWWVLFGKQ